jgi:L-aminopeptidase/D-esterase-like protein
MRRVDRVHAVVLSGGSAYGLDAASGVMRYLEEKDIGVRVGTAVVPIVASAILFDLGLVTDKVRPGPDEGYTAARSANSSPVVEGTAGAGTGATVGKTLGPERSVKGGIGSAALTLPDGSTVAALIAVNAVGDVADYRTGQLLAGPRRLNNSGQGSVGQGSVGLGNVGLGNVGMVSTVRALLHGEEKATTDAAPSLSNTTIGVVATDATLTKEEANWLARVSHDGLALTIRPCHTPRDGDTMFAMATNHRQTPADLTALGTAAVEVTARSVIRAIKTATGLGGIPAISELEHDA